MPPGPQAKAKGKEKRRSVATDTQSFPLTPPLSQSDTFQQDSAALKDSQTVEEKKGRGRPCIHKNRDENGRAIIELDADGHRVVPVQQYHKVVRAGGSQSSKPAPAPKRNRQAKTEDKGKGRARKKDDTKAATGVSSAAGSGPATALKREEKAPQKKRKRVTYEEQDENDYDDMEPGPNGDSASLPEGLEESDMSLYEEDSGPPQASDSDCEGLKDAEGETDDENLCLSEAKPYTTDTPAPEPRYPPTPPLFPTDYTFQPLPNSEPTQPYPPSQHTQAIQSQNQGPDSWPVSDENFYVSYVSPQPLRLNVEAPYYRTLREPSPPMFSGRNLTVQPVAPIVVTEEAMDGYVEREYGWPAPLPEQCNLRPDFFQSQWMPGFGESLEDVEGGGY